MLHTSLQSYVAHLSSDGVRSSREQLGDTGSLEPSLYQTKRSSQPSSSCPHHHRIVCMIHHRIVSY